MERALQGDREAFGVLAARYYRMISVLALQRTGHRTDAEDIAQEALIRAYRALGALRDGDRFAAWLYNITLKLCIDWMRRRERRDPPLPIDEEGDVPASRSARLARPDVSDALERDEERQRILGTIGALPDKYRLVVTLRYMRRMSYKEIAVHLGEPPGTVANRLHRATRMLQERLGALPEALEEPR